MTWFIFSLSSIFALALAELTQQYLLNLKDGFSPRVSTVLTYLIQAILVFPIIIILGNQKDLFTIFQPEIFPKVLVVTVIATFAMMLYLKSFKVKNISLSTIFLSSSIIVSTTIGIIFLNESISTTKFIGIGFVLISIIILNLKNPVIEKNHFYAILAGVLFGTAYSFDKNIVTYSTPLIYFFWALFLGGSFAFLIQPKHVVNSLKGKKLISYKPILISAIGYGFYNFFTFSAYKIGGEVGRVDAINNSQIFIIILFEYFVLKHTEGTKRKLLSATLAFTGVLILGLT